MACDDLVQMAALHYLRVGIRRPVYPTAGLPVDFSEQRGEVSWIRRILQMTRSSLFKKQGASQRRKVRVDFHTFRP